MTPRVGGKYRTRAGYVAEITSFDPDPLAIWPWKGTVEIGSQIESVSWMLSGRGFGAYTDDPIDLMEEIPFWWCPTCAQSVPNEHVTFAEKHDPRAGGCGGQVQ